MRDQDRLGEYVAVWWEAVDHFTALLEDLSAEEWRAPTDLPGWDVHAVAAHTAHLEALAAGAEHEEVELGDVDHARGAMGAFTEQGVVARRHRSPDELINEIRSSATTRHTTLLADPPTDPEAPAPGPFGLLGWTTRTLLRNRPLDLWMHEQDVRRATSRPANLDSRAAVHTVDYLTESLGLVLARRASAPSGTTAVLEVAGHAPRAFLVTDQGRGEPLAEPPDDPSVRIRTDRESFVLLAGGRRAPRDGAVEVTGDTALGERVLAAMAVTP